MKHNNVLKQFSKMLARVESERAAVFMEYTLLFALFAIVICMPLIPGGPAYTLLHDELTLRVVLISLPIF